MLVPERMEQKVRCWPEKENEKGSKGLVSIIFYSLVFTFTFRF